MTLSLVAFLLAQPAARPRAWMLLAWAAAAMGVLTKGLVAAAIPAAVLLIYSACTREFSPWRRLHMGLGLPLFLIITVPWHWLAARRMEDFLQFFFVHEHFARYLTPIADRQEPWWFFGGVFLAGSMPWVWPALRVLGTGLAAQRLSRGPSIPGRFLWIWVVFIGVFFSLSDSKLMPYILPLMPALALLIGAQPAAALGRDCRLTAVLTLIAGLGLGLASLNWPSVLASSNRAEYFLGLAGPVGQIALLLAVSGAFVLVRGARGEPGGPVSRRGLVPHLVAADSCRRRRGAHLFRGGAGGGHTRAGPGCAAVQRGNL